jgi:GT2 family glycosyltransferase
MKNELVTVVIVTRNRTIELEDCVSSCLKSSYKPLEIIIVDNGSEKPVKTWLPKKFPGLHILTCPDNLGAAEGRNVGLRVARGSYLLFCDDDATVDKDMITHLVGVFQSHKKAGIVQPLIYDMRDPSLLQGAGHDINLLTGRITAWGAGEKDTGQYDSLREIPFCGCIWMVPRKVMEKIGEYDSEYFIPYEDSDYSMRARKAGYTLYCEGSAKAWHLGKKSTYVNRLVEYIGITSPERGYRVARNKLIFLRKHAGIKFVPFFFFILPIYALLHTIFIVLSRRFDILTLYWKGLLSGIYYSIAYPFRKNS